MTIHLRFLILIASVMGVLFGGIWLQDYWDEKETFAMRHNLTAEREVLMDNILEITGEPLRVFVTDYSPWDEMVNFVAKPDEEWARINIVESLGTHQIDAAWIFRPDRSEVFGTVATGREELRPFPLPQNSLVTISSGNEEIHFFAITSAGLIEVLGAQIRHSDRSVSNSTPFGWLFAARLWNADYLRRLSVLTASEVSLVSPAAPVHPAPGDKFEVTNTKALTDWKGESLQLLKLRHAPIALKHMKTDSEMDLLISTGFGLLALIAFFFATRQWVVRPLRLLEASLIAGSAAPLRHLRKNSKEFVRLGELVEKSFQHEQTLRQIFAAFNAIEDAAFVLDTETRRITHANDGAVKLLGYRHDQLQGKLLAELEAGPVGSAHPLRIQSPQTRTTCWYRCHGGRLVEVEIREQPLPTSAVAPLRVIVARDVTDLKRQEQHRLQAQRLESLGNLAGGRRPRHEQHAHPDHDVPRGFAADEFPAEPGIAGQREVQRQTRRRHFASC